MWLKRQWILLLFSLLTLITVSCINEHDITITEEEPLEQGKVRVELYTNIPEYEYPATRATANETAVSTTPMILVFEGSGTTAVFSEAVQAKYTNAKTTADLSANQNACEVMVVSNLPGNKFYNGIADVDFDVATLTPTLDGKTLQECEQLLMTPRLTTGTQVTSRPFPNSTDALPMSGIVSVSSIDVDTKIGEAGNKMLLTRVVAKASVQVDNDLTSTFTLQGAAIINVPRNASVARMGALPTPPASQLCNYLSAGDGVTGMATAVNNTTANNPLYIYECSEASGTAMIIKAKYNNVEYYYKLLFLVNESKINIERNKNYEFVIKAAAKGYLTMEDAVEGIPSNIQYEITVTDTYGHDIISNGQYYLGVSNSNVVVYDDEEVVITNAFTITTDATSENGILTAQITWGGGLTNPSTSTVNLSPMAGNTGITTVSVTMPAAVINATATIQVGNLTKIITFTRENLMNYTGVMKLPYNDYVSCELVNTGVGDWLAISPDGQNEIKDNITFYQPGELYFKAEMNTTAKRGGGLAYVTRGEVGAEKGRTLVVVKQDCFDLSTIDPVLPSDGRFYVGAYWRADQTGERLIRIPYQAGLEGEWSAVVLEGSSWVMLDTAPTEDSGITWVESTESPADMNISDAQYQLPANAGTQVSGTLGTTQNDYLYFRIGLRSKNTSGVPRYGVILLTYNDGQKVSLLYLRQGEQDDYLMRPTDGMTGNPSLRPLAAKISPYNLTAAEYEAGTKSGGNSITDHAQTAVKGGIFTDYPSQIGAYFFFACTNYPRYAIHPTNPSTGIINESYYMTHSKDLWKDLVDEHETCPPGYRRPTSGKTDEWFSPTTLESEIRQSLFLAYKGTGIFTTINDPSNSHWGFYADGFFDRRTQVQAPGSYIGKGTCVSVSDHRVACMGTLFFNPNTHASLFFPAGGLRTVMMSECKLELVGERGSFWTSSAPGNTSAYNVEVGFMTGTFLATMLNYVRDTAFQIRCVKE